MQKCRNESDARAESVTSLLFIVEVFGFSGPAAVVDSTKEN